MHFGRFKLLERKGSLHLVEEYYDLPASNPWSIIHTSPSNFDK